VVTIYIVPLFIPYTELQISNFERLKRKSETFVLTEYLIICQEGV